LLKVIEYNKIELLENDSSIQQSTQFEEEFEYQLLQAKTLEVPI